MVIIKCNAAMPDEQRRRLEINIHDQAADGIIVLPYFCDLLTVTTDGEGIQIVQPTQDDRVAELEQELARATRWAVMTTTSWPITSQEKSGGSSSTRRACNGYFL